MCISQLRLNLEYQFLRKVNINIFLYISMYPKRHIFSLYVRRSHSTYRLSNVNYQYPLFIGMSSSHPGGFWRRGAFWRRAGVKNRPKMTILTLPNKVLGSKSALWMRPKKRPLHSHLRWPFLATFLRAVLEVREKKGWKMGVLKVLVRDFEVWDGRNGSKSSKSR